VKLIDDGVSCEWFGVGGAIGGGVVLGFGFRLFCVAASHRIIPTPHITHHFLLSVCAKQLKFCFKVDFIIFFR